MTVASRSSFQQEVGNFKGQCALAYGLIKNECAEHIPAKDRGVTIDQLCNLTGWKTNVASARICNLADAGALKEAGTRGTQTIWVVSLPHEVQALKAARDAAKGLRGHVVAIQAVSETSDHITLRVPHGHKVRIDTIKRLS